MRLNDYDVILEKFESCVLELQRAALHSRPDDQSLKKLRNIYTKFGQFLQC